MEAYLLSSSLGVSRRVVSSEMWSPALDGQGGRSVERDLSLYDSETLTVFMVAIRGQNANGLEQVRSVSRVGFRRCTKFIIADVNGGCRSGRSN